MKCGIWLLLVVVKLGDLGATIIRAAQVEKKLFGNAAFIGAPALARQRQASTPSRQRSPSASLI
jgi:hypothetical protein